MTEKEELDLKWAGYIEEYRKKYEDKLAAVKEKESSELLEKIFLQEVSNDGENNETEQDRTIFETAAGNMLSGVSGNKASSIKKSFNNVMYVQNESEITEKPQTYYKGKNIRLRINDEVMDIKDVEMNITKKFSRHDDLFMKFTIKTEEVSKYYSYVFSYDNTLEIELAKSVMDFKRIFHTFNIEKIEIEENIGERSVVIIETKSASYQMDKIKGFRSFQDTGLIYETIIEILKEKYPDMKWFIGRELSQKLKKPYIQYNETDWEFLVRIAGDLNIPLFSHLDSIIIGNEINMMEERAELRNAVYGKSRDGVNIMFNVKGSTQAVNAGQRMKIIVPDQGIHGEVGEDIRIVSKAYVRIEEDQVITNYELIQKNHKFDLAANSTFEGKTIEAKVMEVVSESGIAKMKIDLSVGLLKASDNDRSKGYEDEYKGEYNFPYMTGFSQNNSGFFCTPEAGDVVSLFFNSRNEGHAYVLPGAVNSPGNDRFNNPNVRNYTLGEDDSAGGKPMFEFQLSSKDFGIRTTNSIVLNTKNQMNISSSEKISMTSNEKTVITNGTSLEQANVINLSSSSETSVISSGKMSVVSSDDMTVGSSSTTNVGGGAFTHVKGAKARVN